MSRLLLFLSIFAVMSTGLSAQGKKMKLVAEANCGTKGKDIFLVQGGSYSFPAAPGIAKNNLSCSFGDKVVYLFDGMDIQATYSVELSFYSNAKRVIKILSDTRELGVVELKPGKLLKKKIDLPKFAYAYGKMRLVFEKVEGSNAVISGIKVYSSNPKNLKTEKGLEVAAPVDYSEFSVPAPMYAPFPKSVAGVVKPLMTLNGDWQFNVAPNKDFPSVKGSGWKAIKVPGHWATQGFTVKDGTYAGYTREFDVPKDWSGKHIRLRFDSVFSDCVVYVNGEEVGRHLGTFTAFELDVTEFVVAGKNDIQLKVRNDSEADILGSLNQYANFPLGGILRKVTLFALPKLNITDLRIDTRFDAEFKDAVLNLQFEVTNTSEEEFNNAKIVVTVPGAVKPYTIPVSYLDTKMNGVVTASIIVKEPKKWDNEHPNLYMLEVALVNGEKELETTSKRFGFRQVEVRGKHMLVNGKAIKLAGVNRHEAHPLLGRSLTMKEWRKDAELFMEANCNFIRTSHYPPSEEFIEVCDELGLFVELEAPVCWVGHHANKFWRKNNFRDKKWYPYMLQANMETIRFHRNNPSIVLWSLANESYWSENFVQILKQVKKEDVTRSFAYHDQDYGGFNNLGSNAPVANIHYAGPNGDQSVKNYKRPITFGEFCHLNVYNRQELVTDPGIRNTWGECLDRIWVKMYNCEPILGGSIWSGIDDLFLLPNGKAVGYGAWGPIDGWRRPKPEYFYMKKVFSPVIITQKKIEPVASKFIGSDEIELSVENRHTFTNISELTIDWTIGDRKGQASADIKPRSTGKLVIPTYAKTGEVLAINFTSPKGFLIDRFLLNVGDLKVVSVKSEKESKVTVNKTNGLYKITSENIECLVDAKTGMITTVTKDGQKVIDGGFNLLVNNLKGGGCSPNHSANTPAWDPICTNWKASKVTLTNTDEVVTVVATGKYAEAAGTFTYEVHGNGEIKVDYDFKTLKKENPRQVGLVMFLTNDFTKVTWERTALFGGFPKEHIGRLKGSAPAFYHGKPDVTVAADGSVTRKFLRKQPEHPWSEDANELGCADFRGTRTGILFYEMESTKGNKIRLQSDGSQAGRCRLDGDKVRLYSIDIDTGGSELFLGGHLHFLRKRLAKGATIKGSMKLQLK
ncbi:MAG: glycoside hydrolase family 2 [Lentisphaeria bacterium]|nr:glycoside hydrolase family 2 [Lentisphaeria bacterium]